MNLKALLGHPGAQHPVNISLIFIVLYTHHICFYLFMLKVITTKGFFPGHSCLPTLPQTWFAANIRTDLVYTPANNSNNLSCNQS